MSDDTPESPEYRDFQRQLGRTIQRLRRGQGISQEAFADRIEVHRTYAGAVERGEKNISLKNIVRIAQGLGLTAGDLLVIAEAEQRANAAAQTPSESQAG